MSSSSISISFQSGEHKSPEIVVKPASEIMKVEPSYLKERIVKIQKQIQHLATTKDPNKMDACPLEDKTAQFIELSKGFAEAGNQTTYYWCSAVGLAVQSFFSA